MKSDYRQVLISAPSKQEAEKISDLLLNKKLIAGSFIIKVDSFIYISSVVHGYYGYRLCFRIIGINNSKWPGF